MDSSHKAGRKALAPILAEVGNLVTSWNGAEAAARELLACIASGKPYDPTPAAYILTAELGSTALVHALKSYAKDLMEPPFREVLLHAVEHFERVRIYRNYYVHGITNALADPAEPEKATGVIGYTTSKGVLAFHYDTVDIPKLRRIAGWCSQSREFIQHLRIAYSERSVPPPSPDMLPLPESLTKPRRSLKELRPPPQP